MYTKETLEKLISGRLAAFMAIAPLVGRGGRHQCHRKPMGADKKRTHRAMKRASQRRNRS